MDKYKDQERSEGNKEANAAARDSHGQTQALLRLLIFTENNAQVLSRYFRKRGCDEQLAQDLSQDTILEAWIHLDRYDLDRPFTPWIMGIARNVQLMFYRTTKYRLLYDTPLDMVDTDILLDMSNQERQVLQLELLSDLLAQLTPTDFQVIFLTKILGHSSHEAATAIGLTDNALRQRLRRALTTLRNLHIDDES